LVLVFINLNLANIKRKLYPINSVNDSLNLVALYFSIFALQFWIAASLSIQSISLPSLLD
jgi:hypothetical protein